MIKNKGTQLIALLLISTIMSAGIAAIQPITAASTTGNSFVPVFQKGMSYVSWPPNFDTANSNESLRLLSLTHSEWVAICVFWYQDTITSTIIHAADNTPSKSSVEDAINRAHELGMKVMLKPMVDPLDGNWRGEIPPSDAWFQSYGTFMNSWAIFSQQNKVDLLCIGCEFSANDDHTANWEAIAAGVRQQYCGPITYAATTDRYQGINWWGSLDYVGIDAYFVLTQKSDPTVEELKAGWAPWASAMDSWQGTVDKPIIFPEIGYRSIQGANKAPWDYMVTSPVDLQEQVNCYNATFHTFYDKSWFYGFYWWNWETSPTAGGSSSPDFTPQNKPAQDLLKSWYAQSWDRTNSYPATSGTCVSPGPQFPWLWVTIGIVIAVIVATIFLLVRKKRSSLTFH